MGHVQRAMEEAGMPTVSVYVKSFGHIPELMGLSRSVITQHPMGRPLGAPGDGERQRAVINMALGLLANSDPTIVEFPEPYRLA
ncbi:MAG: hypothetical protein ACKVK3_03685 [Acidimicrobiales bacterium]